MRIIGLGDKRRNGTYSTIMSSKVRIVVSWISTVDHESKLRITEVE